ncbi:Dsec\GM13028-PA-like protein [Anopheles sinensis]|uniref:Dsec\GM13028-PA-like protein n=1 Tax=Anopheles sinensis TaxID=74873 RepID=A0A084WPS4_ANOSI|nr:Dsec\GM13028-PA-like protein [Anopheles sinensis]
MLENGLAGKADEACSPEDGATSEKDAGKSKVWTASGRPVEGQGKENAANGGQMPKTSAHFFANFVRKNNVRWLASVRCVECRGFTP